MKPHDLRRCLQSRAERAAKQFAEKGRKPLVIEFAGVPKAGKTTTLTNVSTFLKRCGFRTEVVIERASVCPIQDKKNATFNVWTACMTLAQILEKTQTPPRPDDPQILFLDRGLFDSICWITMMERISRIRLDQKEIIERFLMIDNWCKRISAVFVMRASPQDAMKRERGVLPVEGVGGSIMNTEVLKQIGEVNKKCVDEFGDAFRIFPIDTSFGETRDNPGRTAEVVTEAILALIEEQVAEEIISCPKESVVRFFAGASFIRGAQADALVRTFRDAKGDSFRPRDEVEADGSRVQAIPIVIVRNASGDVLRLRRREKTADNPLHDKIVIWAGGHVRREDSIAGDPLVRCAVRELEEELRLQIDSESLHLIGAVYFDTGGKTSKHLGVAYEWQASTDDVAVVLSRSEFFERRGNSLSGSFASIDALAREVEEHNLKEPWSVELIREYLAKGSFDFTPTLI